MLHSPPRGHLPGNKSLHHSTMQLQHRTYNPFHNLPYPLTKSSPCKMPLQQLEVDRRHSFWSRRLDGKSSEMPLQAGGDRERARRGVDAGEVLDVVDFFLKNLGLIIPVF